MCMTLEFKKLSMSVAYCSCIFVLDIIMNKHLMNIYVPNMSFVICAEIYLYPKGLDINTFPCE